MPITVATEGEVLITNSFSEVLISYYGFQGLDIEVLMPNSWLRGSDFEVLISATWSFIGALNLEIVDFA